MVSLDTEEENKTPVAAESAPVVDHLALNQQSNSYTSAQSVTEANNQREDDVNGGDGDENDLDHEEEDIDDELDIEKTKEGLWTLLTG